MSSRHVRLSGVGFAYTDATELFTNADLHLPAGWSGVVGPNGSGKTTLLRLVAGDLRPLSGIVERRPVDGRIVSCSQTVDAPDDALHAFALDWEAEARRLRARLGLDPEQIERWPTLSPGERKRWQIGAALAIDPDVMLLDEPTNHLDEVARARLLDALRGFRGVGLVVAHDRAFLDALVDRVVWIEAGTVRVHDGGFADARRTRAGERDTAVETRRRARADERRLHRALDDRARARRSAESNISPRRRMKGPKDHDARSVSAKGRAAKAEAALARGVRALSSRHLRAERTVELARVEKELGAAVDVDWVPAPSRRLGSLVIDELTAGDTRLLGPTSLTLERDSRVWLRGPNGCGKSTLLAALRDALRLPSERFLWLDQELDDRGRRAALASARSLPPADRGRLLQIVAALGCEPARVLASEHPSPGEAKKLLLAGGLSRRVWALALDEPENHLDLPSIERLEAALRAYPGALVLVTHDDQLGRALTRTTWQFHDGRVDVSSTA